MKILLGTSQIGMTDLGYFHFCWSFRGTSHSLLWSGQGLKLVSVNAGTKGFRQECVRPGGERLQSSLRAGLSAGVAVLPCLR